MKKQWVTARTCLLILGSILGLSSLTAWGVFLTRRNYVKFIKKEISKEDQSSHPIELRYSQEYLSWKRTTDTTFYSLYNGNQSVDLLQIHPEMVILWAGYAFSKDYATPRGHMYSVEDTRKSLRTGAPTATNPGQQPASCWSCKSTDVPRLTEQIGLSAFYQKKWAEWGSETVNPIGCADCHEQESMELRVSRPHLVEALRRQGKDIENASGQEMRSFVCAQCHSEYYFKGADKEVTVPWDQGYSVENIEAYYDQISFSDFTHPLSRTPLLKAQHPDFELAQAGIHAQRGVSCGECHMPYGGNEEHTYNNHHIQSPLAMIEHTCQTCHRESKETLRNNVYDRQKKAMATRNRVEQELVKAHIEAKFAWDKGASEAQMKNILQLIRQAQWRWDFAIASHGASFHAPQEVQRILGDALDKTLQARMAIFKLLVTLGYTHEVPMPDLSSKEKAQKYIGLDMEAERVAKDKFLQTVLPIWIEEARINKRILEEK